MAQVKEFGNKFPDTGPTVNQTLARSLLLYETRTLHAWVAENMDISETRALAARILQATLSLEMGDAQGCIDALKGEG